ncbi:DUF736 domain-containing protein [Sphingopyxis sp. FD7]|uniref:DUF736 domain-containing protein n=1 Tax=Sphingopyxis sp. FD7 TaxID=1914525 RepID=UPI000DC61A0F|nr:DUF736 domain-containing protein [Sphingopyxis sp. FD7]BBB13977.1 hypothetical protein SPYCA_3235 [Sphingopyxis sp. FD7]
MKIGYFVSSEDGFSGHISTLTLDVDVVLLAAEPSDNENAPDYRVIASEGDEAREIGAGWKRTGEKAGDYLAIQIDDPMFVAPLRANLFRENGNGHILIWSRPSRHDKAD